MNPVTSRLFVLLQRLLPRSLLTKIVWSITRSRNRRLKNWLIEQFIKRYKVETDEISEPVPDGFATFNEFFVRELKPGRRPIDKSKTAVASPVDGKVSACGSIEHGRLFQAKGLHYTVAELLVTDIPDAARYSDGAFATIYLAPNNYHRVHLPFDGQLTALRYVPGDLYSVNDATVSRLPKLFARNERLVCQLETELGDVMIVLVGALNVGTISTPWTGEIRPRKSGVVDDLPLQSTGLPTKLAKGELLGWFNMGSTVIIMMPAPHDQTFRNLEAGQAVRMGERIGSVTLPD